MCGRTIEEHNRCLRQVFQRTIEQGDKFNQAKCVFITKEVKYLGHVFSDIGVTADPERAAKDMPSPSNVKDMQRFLGLLNYLSPFIPNLPTEVAPLRDFIKKDSSFQWNTTYNTMYNKLKQLIFQAPVLLSL